MKHCFHDVATDQRSEDHRCCWCNVERDEYDKTGHGPFYQGIGKLVSHAGEDCPKRLENSSESGTKRGLHP